MSQPSRTNKYIRHIFLLVESGVLLIGITIVVFVLYNLNDAAALAVLDIATQIAVRRAWRMSSLESPGSVADAPPSGNFLQALVTYLVVVRSGFGLMHGLPGSTPDKTVMTSSLGNMVYRMDNLDRVRADTACIQITREVVTDVDKNSNDPSDDADYKTDLGSPYAA